MSIFVLFVFFGQIQKLNFMGNSLILLPCIANPSQVKVRYQYWSGGIQIGLREEPES
jgi:hypothetical protein